MKANYDQALARENQRVAERRVLVEGARRKLLPIMVATCETFGVAAGDILSVSHHPHVCRARNVVAYLGWQRCKISSGILSEALNRERTGFAKKLCVLRRLAAEGGEFSEEIDRVVLCGKL